MMKEISIINDGADNSGISNEDPEPRSHEQRNQQDRDGTRFGFRRRFLSFVRRYRKRDTARIMDDVPAQPSATHRDMVENITRLHEARVGDLMIARSEIEAIEINTSLADALLLFEQSGHSRLPVYVETLDDPRGMVHIRDVLSFVTRTARSHGQDDKIQQEEIPTERSSPLLNFSLVDLSQTIGEIGVVREVLFVPAAMRAGQLLSRMQSTRTQMALIIDEYGGTDGLASMEDVFELVVGDIEDEHDDDDVMIIAEGESGWLVDARAELEELNMATGEVIDWGEPGEDVDTIGGLIVSKLAHIPAGGEKVEIGGYCFHVVEADHRRIRRVRVKKLS